MPFGLVRQDLGKTLQILFEQGQRAAQLQHQAAVHGVLAGGAEMHVALGSASPAATWRPSALTSGIAELPAVATASASASGSYSSARQAASIGATAVAGTTPVRASARARAASKSSMPCRRPRSENTARIGAAVK
ncbi:Uncharacterised protein [Pseudomonas aeruginosa]|nr:Uncharacterised protein [Pseudomonas aeruginosa]